MAGNQITSSSCRRAGRDALYRGSWASISIIALSVLASGCATMNSQVANDDLAHLKIGISTEHQAIELLGVSRTTTHNQDGTNTMTFYFSNLSTPTLCQLFLVCGIDSYEKVDLVFDATNTLRVIKKATIPKDALPATTRAPG